MVHFEVKMSRFGAAFHDHRFERVRPSPKEAVFFPR